MSMLPGLAALLLASAVGPTCHAGYVALPASSAGTLETHYGAQTTYQFALTSGDMLDTSGSQYGTPAISSGLVFDTAGLSGAAVSDAALKLTVRFYQATSIASASVRVFGFAAGGPTLARGDFFDAWDLVGSAALPGADGISPVVLSFDVAPLLLSAGGRDVGFILDVTGNVEFCGIGSGPSSAPGLMVSQVASVPEPSSLALCGVGVVLGVAAWRARRRRQ